VLDTFDRYLELAEWQPHDHVIVAANPHLLATVVFDLPHPSSWRGATAGSSSARLYRFEHRFLPDALSDLLAA
jgi:hypothetical protein